MRLDSTYIVTPQLDRAVAFYSLVFQRDPTVIIPWSDDGIQRGAIYDLAERQHFILSQEKGFEEALLALANARSPFFLVFTVDDVQVEYARLLTAGLTIPKPPQMTPSGAVAFEFLDPDGHGIRISERWTTPLMPITDSEANPAPDSMAAAAPAATAVAPPEAPRST